MNTKKTNKTTGQGRSVKTTINHKSQKQGTWSEKQRQKQDQMPKHQIGAQLNQEFYKLKNSNKDAPGHNPQTFGNLQNSNEKDHGGLNQTLIPC